MNAKNHSTENANQALDSMKTILSLFLLLLPCAVVRGQAVASAAPFVKAHFVAADGGPCAGCLLWSYAAGTTIPQATYTTTAGNVANTNPAHLDGAGYVDIFLGPSPYKFILETAAIPGQHGHGAVVWTEDNITNSAQLASVAYLPPYTGGITRTSTSKWAEEVSVQDFGADPTGVVDSSGSFQAAINVGASSRGGVAAKIPCGSYTLGSTVTMALPTQSLIGENESCVHLNYIGTASAIVWQMSPFTITPAGEMSGFTLSCLSAAQNGILSGQIVGSYWHDINVVNCTASGAAGIHLHNAGNLTTWTERNDFINVSVGGLASGYNTIGLLMDSDVPGNSFGYNRFIDLKINASTGGIGLYFKSGFFYNSILNGVCNIDNNVAGSVGAICVRSSANWDSNYTILNGEFQNSGAGTGTPYSVQVDAGGKFANIGGQVSVFAPGGGLSAFNNLAGASGVPSVTVHQQRQPDWDTGTYTLGSLGATTPWTAFRDNGPAALGILEGSNAASPFVSMFNFSGNKFLIGKTAAASALGTMTEVASFDTGGNLFNSGAIWGAGITSGTTDANFKLDINGAALIRGPNAPDGGEPKLPLVTGYKTGANWAGAGSAFFTRSGTGIQEQIQLSDQNGQSGLGSVVDTNVAHPMGWCYGVDPACFEWYSKAFNTPLSSGNKIASLSSGGNFTQNGNTIQIGGPGGPIWQSANGGPSGACTSGSIYTNRTGSGAPSTDTLFVCIGSAWRAASIP